MTFDLAVVGAGVAGLNAAAEAARAGLSCVLIDPMGAGGELMNIGTVHHCATCPPNITGVELGADLMRHALEAGVQFAFATVTSLEPGRDWRLVTDDQTYRARSVILACGLGAGALGLSDEARYSGRGLSHCAACDGPLYVDQAVAITGGGRWTVQEAADLLTTCRSVVLITEDEGVTLPTGATVAQGRVVEVRGEDGLEEVIVEHEGTRRAFAVRGLFVQGGRTPALAFAPSGLDCDAQGRPRVSPSLACNLPMLFAAGTVRGGGEVSIDDAAADGRAAAWAAREALQVRPTACSPSA